MNATTKEEIRAALERATKLPIGEIYPDGFIGDNKGGLIQAIVEKEGIRYLKTGFVQLPLKMQCEPRNVVLFGFN